MFYQSNEQYLNAYPAPILAQLASQLSGR